MRDSEFNDPAFVARLRAGDHAAFRSLVRRFHGSLVGVAASIIGSRAQGEEVVQDAWLAVFSGIAAFQGRSNLLTWIFSIVLNRARTRASREGRLVGLPASLEGSGTTGEAAERAVPLSAFQPEGHWREAPLLWEELDPERIVAGRQLWDHVQDSIERLPAGQRAVIILRDMEGCSAEEACALLGITAENQRVLLHRARGRIRKTIDTLVTGQAAGAPTSADRQPAAPTSTAPISRFVAVARRCIARIGAAFGGRPVDSLPMESPVYSMILWAAGNKATGR